MMADCERRAVGDPRTVSALDGAQGWDGHRRLGVRLTLPLSHFVSVSLYRYLFPSLSSSLGLHATLVRLHNLLGGTGCVIERNASCRP